MSAPGPRIDERVISEIRHRVIAHNEACRDEAHKVRLGELRKIFQRTCRGPNAEVSAFARIDRHLKELRKADGTFDENEHPRGQGGKFRSKGQRGGMRQVMRDVATPAQHKEAKEENYGYRQLQTAVIPETRYSTYGPPLATAAGVTAGAITGATTTSLKGDLIDRTAKKLAGKAGGFVGERLVGGTVATAAVAGRAGLRAAARTANRHLGTKITEPPLVDDALIEGARKVGRRVGRAAGHAAVAVPAGAIAFPSWAARTLARRGFGSGGGAKARIISGLVGGAVGSVVPGYYVYGRALHHGAETAGPFLDAAFPRRVEKLDPGILALIERPDVLAKCDEMLAKAENDELAKVSLSALTSAVGRSLRGLTSSAPKATVRRSYRMADGSRIAARTGRSFRAALTAGGGAVGSAAGSIAGAGIGALTARNQDFEQKHPRDEKGRFAEKTSAAGRGAIIGAALGAGVGMLLGHGAGARINTQLARALREKYFSAGHVEGLKEQAADAARERVATRVMNGDVTRPSAKRTGAEAAAARKLAGQKPLTTNGEAVAAAPGQKLHPMVRTHLARQAEKRFDETVGAAASSPRGWVVRQVDEAFDKEFNQMMTGKGGLGAEIPLRAGVPGKTRVNLFHNVDHEKLEGEPKKLWDDLTARREAVLGEIDTAINARRSAADGAEQKLAESARALKAAKSKTAAISQAGAQHIDDQSGVKEMRAFLEERLGDKPPRGMTAEAMRERLHEKLTAHEENAASAIEALQAEHDSLKEAVNHTSAHAEGEITTDELKAIRNPFRTGRDQPEHFTARPSSAELAAMRANAAKNDPVVAAFDKLTTARAAKARRMVGHVVNAQQKAIDRAARTRMSDRAAAFFHRQTPKVAAAVSEAADDLAAVRDHMLAGKQPKGFWAWAMNPNSKEATDWITRTAKNAGDKAGKVGQWVWNNKGKTAGTVYGLAEAIGGVRYDEKKGTRVELNPLNWSLPEGLKIERDVLDPLNSDKVVVGVTYRHKSGQRRFLAGGYDDGRPLPEGQNRPFQSIAFDSPVDQVKARVRSGNQSGQGGHSGPTVGLLHGEQSHQAAETIKALRQKNQIKSFGSGDWNYSQNTGGSDGNDLSNAAYRAFVGRYNGRWAHWRSPKSDRVTDHGLYFRALKDLFDSRDAALLTASQRVDALTGRGTGGLSRGIFAHSSAYDSPNANGVKQALLNEMNGHGAHTARTEDERRQLHRAVDVVGRHYGLSFDDMKDVHAAVVAKAETHVPRQDAGQRGPAAPQQPRRSALNHHALAEELWDNGRGKDLFGGRLSKEDFVTAVGARYRKALSAEAAKDPTATEQELHRRAIESTEQQAKFGKLEPAGPLRKVALLKGTDFGGVAGKAIGGSFDDIVMAVNRQRRNSSTKQKPSAPRPFYEPVRLGDALGNYGGNTAGWDAASHLWDKARGTKYKLDLRGAPRLGADRLRLTDQRPFVTRTASKLGATASVGAKKVVGAAEEKVAAALAPGIARRAAGSAVGLGLKFAGGMAGGALGEAGMTALASGGYRLLGYKPPKGFVPHYKGYEGTARMIGGVIGQGIGGSLGSAAGPVGTVGGAAAGGVAGDEIAGWLYRHLSGSYGHHTAKGVARHFK